MPDGLYPVLVSGRADEDDSKGGKGGGGDRGKTTMPFLQLSIIKEVNNTTNTAHFNYVAFRSGYVFAYSESSFLHTKCCGNIVDN